MYFEGRTGLQAAQLPGPGANRGDRPHSPMAAQSHSPAEGRPELSGRAEAGYREQSAIPEPPQPPEKPLPSDCCDSGCAVCVFDLYADALQAYQQALERWKQQHPPASGAEDEELRQGTSLYP